VIWIIFSIILIPEPFYYIILKAKCKPKGFWEHLFTFLLCLYPLGFWLVAFFKGAGNAGNQYDYDTV